MPPLPEWLTANAPIVASIIAVLTFIGLALGEVPGLRLNRATIAVVGAGAVVSLGVLTLEQAERTIELSTIALLLSMMIINAVLELSGFFTLIGEVVIERANTPLLLLGLVTVTSGVLSMLFLNDPVCVMLTPLVCGVVLRLRRDPIPYLIALACASNVGSVATITGNPQNILIGTSSGIGYVYWLTRLGPVALIGLLIVAAVVWLLHPREFRWSAKAGGESGSGQDEPGMSLGLGRDEVGGKPGLSRVEAGGKPGLSREEVERTVYMPTLRKSLIVIALMLIAFVTGFNVTLAAFLAACAILISRRVESARILSLIDWPLLLMFTGLFVVTGALETTGASAWLFARVKGLALAGTPALVLVTTVLSNLISNVPAVLLFRPLVPQFPNPTQTWLTLAAASTLAGNLTLVGSVANLIVAEQARKFGVNLSFRAFFKAGVTITLLTLGVAVVVSR